MKTVRHPFIGLSVAVIVVVVVGLLPSGAFAQDDHLKCYKIKDPNKFKGIVDLNTAQFGDELGCKIVIKAKFFCAPASKVVVDSGGLPILPVVGQDLTNDQVCYKIKCDKPFPPDTDVIDQFGSRTVQKLKPKFSMPKLRRVTPRSRIAESLLSVSVPGSHSKVISSALSHALVAFSRSTKLCNCRTDRYDGVPPPK